MAREDEVGCETQVVGKWVTKGRRQCGGRNILCKRRSRGLWKARH